MAGRPVLKHERHRCRLSLLLGLTLALACSSNAEPDAGIENDRDPTTDDASDDEDDTPAKRDAGGGSSRPSDAAVDKPKLDAARPGRDSGSSAADAASGASSDAAATSDAATTGDAAPGNDSAPESDGGRPPSTEPADYAKRGPHEVLTEKNVGKDFRNTNVTDQTAFCRSFVGAVMLPGEMGVDEELTNYPADMDRQLYTMFRPAKLEEGVKYPVISWGNGTCAQPLLYSEILEHLASWGFIVIATNATSVGSGTEILRGTDFVVKESTTEGSALFGHVDAALLGVSGHSQGSSGAIAAAANAKIRVSVPIQGASASGVRALKGPSFLISGEMDTLATPSSIQTAFNAATVPAVYGMAVGQDHLMPGRMPEPILKALTGWFRIHLYDDDVARPLFYGDSCELCKDATWKLTRKNL